MSKLLKIIATFTFVVSFAAFAPGSAEAYCRGGYYSGCGQWGGWGWGPWVLELVGARATHTSTVRVAVGCTFEPGVMGTGSFVAFGAASDPRTPGIGQHLPIEPAFSAKKCTGKVTWLHPALRNALCVEPQ